jgi:Major Facilitator Superfamily
LLPAKRFVIPVQKYFYDSVKIALNRNVTMERLRSVGEIGLRPIPTHRMKKQIIILLVIRCFIFTAIKNKEFFRLVHGFSRQYLSINHQQPTLSRYAITLKLQRNALLEDSIPLHIVRNSSLGITEIYSKSPKEQFLMRSSIPESEFSPHVESFFHIKELTVSVSSEKDEEEGKILILGLLWTIALISALDRVAMSVALVPMATEFDLSDTMKGSISSLFSVGYGLAIIPSGLLVAKSSPKLFLSAGIVLWSLATLATPDSADLLTSTVRSSLAPLLLVRACVGAGESLVLPAIQRLLSVWTTSDQKGSGK